MGSVGIGEIVIILAVVLIIFGPDRLPEIARKGAELIRKSRAATTELTASLRDEYGDVLTPLNEVREELKSVRRDLTSAATSIAQDASAVGMELKSTIDPTLGKMQPPTGDAPGEPADTADALQEPVGKAAPGQDPDGEPDATVEPEDQNLGDGGDGESV